MKKTPIRRPHLTLLAMSMGLALLLPACGGGGGGTSDAQPPAQAPTASAQAAIYFTDDFSATYDAVWVSVARVTVVSPAGETEILRHDTPQLINLPTLRRTGALVATASVPLDATEIRVYVSGQARLQTLDGSMQDVTLQAPAGYLGFKLEGWDSRSGALALDFDLPNFRLEGSTLVAATRLAGSTDLAGWNSRYTEAKGTVTAVSATSITVRTDALGSQTFTLDAQTTFLSERTAGWTPVVGSVVELYGSVSGQGAQALQFSARQVKDRSDGISAASGKVHGVVTGVENGIVTLTVDRSRLAGATGSIRVDVTQARYERGSAALLAPGMRLEAYLVAAAAGNGFTAHLLEIEGASKTRPSGSGADRDDDAARSYSEIKGVVSSVNGQQVVLRALHAKNLPAVLQGSTLTLDLSGAYFERGGLSCLAAGTPIEVKGGVDAAGQMQPVKVELEGACASAQPVAGLPATGQPTSPVLVASFVEAKGLITAVRPGEFDLQVYKLEYAGSAPATVTVRHGAGTTFNRLSAAQLGAGLFVETKGSLLGTVLDASKIELE
ncbi:DUF5666 domain-containing protein [Pseudaquabacterium pictum]|uniref:DUF5666 domain-containing protein n=1 Tax=Pseudaquabacterium pictum TaxID=2315236 RepID=A0A480ASV6_9BURK|nr:DUF5666 domain-containing protein [Rubrivivax pictus]GCL64614.1 hypothetical protein AQPW35_36950 [Rubrivivax pictus]